MRLKSIPAARNGGVTSSTYAYPLLPIEQTPELRILYTVDSTD